MIHEPLKFEPILKLVPCSGVQFVDYAFNIDKAGKLSRRFLERELDQSQWVNGKRTFKLVPAWNELDPSSPYEESAGQKDVEYTISDRQALEVFLEKWVPVPMFRVKAAAEGGEEFDIGPTNWARVRISEIADRTADSPWSHRVIFAFDTELLERRANRPYTAPSVDDAANEHEFRFAYRFSDIAWFLGSAGNDPDSPLGFQEWVPEWLNEMFREYKAAQRPDRPLRETDFPYALEHYARYLVMLEFLQKAIEPRAIRLIDTVSDTPSIRPVGVDMVLDIGNSRTCGILIESHPNEKHVDLNNSFVLQLRDLSAPQYTYSDPFESHVELSQAKFGRFNLSKLSSRGRAFFWPSPVRVGPEAGRFREMAEGTEAVSGLSSPKRYLCDVTPVHQEWRFPARDYSADGTPPLIERAVRLFVNSRGDVISQIEADIRQEKSYRPDLRVQTKELMPAMRWTFSRSSYFTFLVSEVITQALSMINSVGVREKRRTKEAPRLLRRLILTLPPAMPVQEQRILRSRAEAAVKLVWQLMGWWEKRPPGAPPPPEVHVAWDEASCVQFVYLYGEITQKLGSGVNNFFQLMGRERVFTEAGMQPEASAKPEPSIRIASVDIGGGTTDLMVTTYFSEGDRAIKPVQNFRESFRIAGDDLLKGVVEQLVIPGIEAGLRAAGMRDPLSFLKDRFGGDRANMAEQEKHLRRQFVLRVLEPIALRLLADAEQAKSFHEEMGPTRNFVEFFPILPGRDAKRQLPQQRLLDFVEKAARERGAPDFSLTNCEFMTDYSVIRRAATSVLDRVFDNLSEVIHEFDCDVVLLSGRPSRLPAVVDLFVDKLAVPPDRVIPLHLYQAGTWYPFRDRDNRRIGDPKTTTAVGGMLCALAEGKLTNFTLYTNRLVLKSTARYIGELENNGQLTDQKLYFHDIDLDTRNGSGEQEAQFNYYAQMRLGYRQLPLERWIATPIYRLYLSSSNDNSGFNVPIKVTMARASSAVEEDDDQKKVTSLEALKEEFKIISAEDAKGKDMQRRLELVLDTLGSEQGYWLDTGILSV